MESIFSFLLPWGEATSLRLFGSDVLVEPVPDQPRCPPAFLYVCGHVLVVTTLDLTGISLSSDFLRFPICQQYCLFWSSPLLFGRETGCTFQCVIILDTRKLSYFREVRRTQTIAPSLHICWGLTLGLVMQEHLVGHPLKSR